MKLDLYSLNPDNNTPLRNELIARRLKNKQPCKTHMLLLLPLLFFVKCYYHCYYCCYGNSWLRLTPNRTRSPRRSTAESWTLGRWPWVVVCSSRLCSAPDLHGFPCLLPLPWLYCIFGRLPAPSLLHRGLSTVTRSSTFCVSVGENEYEN